MDSFVSPKDEIWFLRVCHHILTSLYILSHSDHDWPQIAVNMTVIPIDMWV